MEGQFKWSWFALLGQEIGILSGLMVSNLRRWP
jgi:hypothetical protein